MFTKPKIVQFENGTYGIRRWALDRWNYEFLNNKEIEPKHPNYWYDIYYQRLCQFTTHEDVKKIYNELFKAKVKPDYGSVLKKDWIGFIIF